jgi:hypothetical protein
MTANDALIRIEFILLPDTVLVLTNQLNLRSFVRLELNTRDSQHSCSNLDLGHRFVFRDRVLDRQGVRAELGSRTVIKDKPQTIYSKTNVALNFFQSSSGQLNILDFLRIGVLKEFTFLKSTNRQLYYLALGLH